LKPPEDENPITEVWGKATSGVQGQSFWSGNQSPLKLKRFTALECPKEAAFWPFLGVLGTHENGGHHFKV